MEAGGAISKRRRSGRGRAREVFADRISALPDPILGDIVSLLPTAQGARTQILASRWRHIWRSARLNLDCNDFRNRDFTGQVRSILSSHPGPGRRFRISARRIDKPSGRGNTRSAVVDAWIRFPALDNLEELDVCYAEKDPLHPLSPFILRLATLCVVSLENCNLSGSTAQGVCLPKLTRLALKQVSISESSLSDIIAGCPALECLKIVASFGFRCLRINSLSLITIGVRAYCSKMIGIQFRELIIENAPRLQRLLHLDGQWSRSSEELHVSVLSVPKLETLSCVLDKNYLSTVLSFGSMIVQGLNVDSLTVVVRTVKILDVALDYLSLDIVMNLMRCFPCLEKLYLQVAQPCRTSEQNLWRHEYHNVARCLDIRLKTITLNSYRGSTYEVNFFTFFVMNVKALESVTLVVGAKKKEFIAEQSRKLQLENGASRGVQFQFTTRLGASYFADVHCP
ncbi:unnamed protein product [Alopecurus aequalis]